MKTVTKEVKTGKKVVGSVDVREVENINEMIENFTEEYIIDRFNYGHRTKVMGDKRAKYTRKDSTKYRREIGFGLLSTDELVSFQGDMDALNEYLDGPEMKVRIDEAIGVDEDDDLNEDDE